MSTLTVKCGWAVQIIRKDGSTFLSSSGDSNIPAVWVKSNRKWAVNHKRYCVASGFKCRVVPVRYADPVEVVETHKPKCLCGHARRTHRKYECQAAHCDCVGYRPNWKDSR